MEITPEKSIIAARMAIGAVFSFVVATYFNLIETTWIYISLFVILFEQNTVGAFVKRSSMRAIATLGSAIYSIIIILLFHNNYLMNLAGLVLGVFLYSYLFIGTKESYIGVLGTVTLAICLINQNDVSYVFIRPTNVIIGILIGSFVLRFFYPRRATTIVIVEIKKFLDLFATISETLGTSTWSKKKLHTDLVSFELSMINQITRFIKTVEEAKIETKNKPQFGEHATDILLIIRHIFRYFTSVISPIINQQMKPDEAIKEKFLVLSQIFTELKDKLHNQSSSRLLLAKLDTKKIDSEKLLPLLVNLISTECKALSHKIEKLNRARRQVNIE